MIDQLGAKPIFYLFYFMLGVNHVKGLHPNNNTLYIVVFTTHINVSSVCIAQHCKNEQKTIPCQRECAF